MHDLQQVFDMAIKQATEGKGERHGGDSVPFKDQPWVHYAKMHGRGFLTGQAAKKLEEAASIRHGEAFVQETLGAIVYLGMAVLHEMGEAKPSRCQQQIWAGPDGNAVTCILPLDHMGKHRYE
jgi:hypothetical protein